MTKKEIIQLYIADLNNLVANSDAKRSRIIDLEDELESLRIHDVAERIEQLVAFLEFVVDYKMLEVDLEYEEIVKRFLGN
jgi:hypothetical protein